MLIKQQGKTNESFWDRRFGLRCQLSISKIHKQENGKLRFKIETITLYNSIHYSCYSFFECSSVDECVQDLKDFLEGKRYYAISYGLGTNMDDRQNLRKWIINEFEKYGDNSEKLAEDEYNKWCGY